MFHEICTHAVVYDHEKTAQIIFDFEILNTSNKRCNYTSNYNYLQVTRPLDYSTGGGSYEN